MEKLIPLSIHNCLYFLSTKEAEEMIEALKTGLKKVKKGVEKCLK